MKRELVLNGKVLLLAAGIMLIHVGLSDGGHLWQVFVAGVFLGWFIRVSKS